MTSIFDAGLLGQDAAAREFLVTIGRRWLEGLERHLQDREWIASEDFTVADILMASVLREFREAELMDDYAGVRAFYARAFARPAWQRTRAMTAERMQVDIADIA